MTLYSLVLPWVAWFGAAVMLGYALRLRANRPQGGRAFPRQGAALAVLVLSAPFAHAQAVDLETAMRAGNGIIMYISGSFAAVGLVAAGVATGFGRQAIAKWALLGAVISGLAFVIVRTIWGNFGLTPPDVSAFNP